MRKAVYSRAGNRNPGHNIALIGMMGSGKNTVANEIGRRSGRAVIDTDASIERKTGRRVSEIFKSDGEAAFRELECAELASVKNMKGSVISCGGGAVLDGKNREALKAYATPVWLWAKPSTILSRVGKGKGRPLLDVPEEDKGKRLAHLQGARNRLYAEACDMLVSTEDKTAEQVAEMILHEIH
jgi:shikimate kinase